MQLVEIKEVADYGRAEKWPPQGRGGGGKAGNRDQGTGNSRVRGLDKGSKGTGIREQGTAGCEGLTREQGTGNREQPGARA